MAIEQANFYCPQCDHPRLFTRQGVNHIFHLIASLFLCGTWLFVWLIIVVSHDTNPYFCQMCGYSDTPKYLANPNLRHIQAQQAERRRQAINNGAQTANSGLKSLADKISAYPYSIHFAGAFFVICLISTVIIIYSAKPTAPAQEPVQQNVYLKDALEQRRQLASSLTKSMTNILKDVLVTASGNSNEILTINSAYIDENFAKNFVNTPVYLQAQEAGFRQIILNARKKQWTFKL